MPTIESILSRAMNDTAFAEQLFSNPEKVWTEYDLSDEEITKIKGISRAQFDAIAMDPEIRKSFSLAGQTVLVRFRTGTDSM